MISTVLLSAGHLTRKGVKAIVIRAIGNGGPSC